MAPFDRLCDAGTTPSLAVFPDARAPSRVENRLAADGVVSSDGGRRSPQHISKALESSGPVFIKLAQWMSTRRDLLSDELCDEMGKLHETVTCHSTPLEISRAEALVPGLKVKNLLGGGCIAQVYAAEMPPLDAGGTPLEVAVKVRRENVPALLETDLFLMRAMAAMSERIWPSMQWLAMQKAIDNFAWYMTQQLDLRIEAEHLEELKSDFRSGRVRGPGRVAIPHVIAVSESVMVTEVARGVSLSVFIKQNQPAKLRRMVFTSLIDMMARMVLVNNFIHGDLHPGNIFVSTVPARGPLEEVANFTDGVVPLITLIDAGISIQMSDSLTSFAKSSMLAAFRMNPEALGKALVEFHHDEGLCSHGENLEELEEEAGYLLLAGCFMCPERIWSRVFDDYQEYRSSRVSEYFTKMIATLSGHKVRVSPSLWALMTAFALVEGSVQELGYGVNVLRAARPYIFRPVDVVGRIGSAMRLSISEGTFKSTR
eukprot:CAMPEP_0178402238 /NCGR_PEP_ID=MMETSP0689_2-20121128/16730_1 /TAXON_ID=160604 /ORGANISM="Amphidinium massartii, Strain CS-259" /LENGTH=484 /DNA_ID=CAMNT_0020023115 /DNA_START=64 /DNA_END=1519 /DNA_ORIENTATION=+